VSRGEDAEVAVTAGEAVGGIVRLGARCGRDLGGAGLARLSARGRGEGVDPDARRLQTKIIPYVRCWGGSNDGGADGVGRRVGQRRGKFPLRREWKGARLGRRRLGADPMMAASMAWGGGWGGGEGGVRRREDLGGDGGRTVNHRMWTPTLLS
jgi:hypothetical protein